MENYIFAASLLTNQNTYPLPGQFQQNTVYSPQLIYKGKLRKVRCKFQVQSGTIKMQSNIYHDIVYSIEVMKAEHKPDSELKKTSII